MKLQMKASFMQRESKYKIFWRIAWPKKIGWYLVASDWNYYYEKVLQSVIASWECRSKNFKLCSVEILLGI